MASMIRTWLTRRPIKYSKVFLCLILGGALLAIVAFAPQIVIENLARSRSLAILGKHQFRMLVDLPENRYAEYESTTCPMTTTIREICWPDRDEWRYIPVMSDLEKLECLDSISFLNEAKYLKLIGLTPAQDNTRLYETPFSQLGRLEIKESDLTRRFFEWQGLASVSNLHIERSLGPLSQVFGNSISARSLRQIDVKDSILRNAWPELLRDCEELQQLSVDNDLSFDDNCMHGIKSVDLSDLRIKNCSRFTGVCLEKFNGGGPTRIWLSSNNHDPNLLTMILELPNVRDIVLDGGSQESVNPPTGIVCISSLSLSFFLKDGNFQFLGNLIHLEELWLNNCNIDGAAIKSLRQLPRLRYLSCCNTSLADQDIAFLAQLTNLSELDVSDTQVTLNGVSTLKASLPHTKVFSRHLEEGPLNKPDLDE